MSGLELSNIPFESFFAATSLIVAFVCYTVAGDCGPESVTEPHDSRPRPQNQGQKDPVHQGCTHEQGEYPLYQTCTYEQGEYQRMYP